MSAIMSFFSSKPANPVDAAQAKVDAAQAALTKAKDEVTRLESELNQAKTELSQAKQTVPLANTTDGVQGGRRKRTYRNKEKRPAKRRRNGRRSIRS
jgi:multidrug efflux pump subunit AcrA (membrane-fusion protein)